ncbi:CDP-diacylglycerol--glycerol-3-phosphate 3-phosphatidyltransferase [Faecalicoccus acidiformans]|uniref:CDP-diacylglycerol--glycerol-3-phosphate 3-phosphatidyltransferase n=1 Tax=Faecalicoccus acidiformans TaxID=915173 RepID=A0A7W8D0Z6_9FIRM|nr:CDP-diacylglycerol--glycerol-3-phosphate 3-phosphatidyltransferase [Faecalicoccus acidiformans]MBB5185196.1 CDP-diacylglycerol--glycerol-3-phosphate 3-phosphatidyltransferase [Faecalicoccus acidiformans]MBM6830507.1 CDP-diacylglycerol--glycerol-3-phosphate 3-phosphatidyltransferase [Faecalicoccus acidiformans]MDM8204111.1 CDP-diacylglycerol--glycerol-3-phosphate 3-phosphatidyltransferase [Faecalicoccus acidiformans]HIW18565.1 CDP-diacylglycerol--glycerol-3-phosphate 3-phosphatidyltransferase
MNLPNKLTVGRIAMVPLVVLIYLVIPQDFCVISATNGLALRDVLAFLIFMLASLTDMFDGQIARKYHLITSFGKFFDPIADKMLVNTMLILLVYTHQANIVAVLLMIARDLIVDGLRMLASQHGKVVSAGIYGKAKTVLQMFAILFLLLKNWPFVYLGLPLDQILLWLACLMSLFSGLIYFAQLKDFVLESM